MTSALDDFTRFDFDDGHYCGGAIHPASVIVPSLIAAVRALDPTTKVSAQTFLTAQIAGYEIGLRAAHLLWPKHTLDDYHCTGTAATLGAAAAVAKLRGGNADAIARSIAIAWALQHAVMTPATAIDPQTIFSALTCSLKK